MPTLGEDLRAARDARKLSLQDVSDKIHIRATYLDAMERESWLSLAEPVYVRGFLRTYARFLDMDPAEAVRRFDASLPPQANERPHAFVRTSEVSGGFSPLLRLAALGALVLVAFVVVSYLQRATVERTSAVAAATAAPTVPPLALAPPRRVALPPAAPAEVRVRMIGRSWISVQVDGRLVFEGISPAGTVQTLHGSHILLRAGNAGGVTVAVGGGPPAPLGPVGSVVARTFDLTPAGGVHGSNR